MTNANSESLEAKQLKEDPNVKRALKQTATNKESAAPVVKTKHKILIGIYVFLLFGLGGLYYVLRLGVFDSFAEKYVPLFQRLTLGAMAVVLALMAAKFVQTYVIGRIDDEVTQYNLKRILRLVTVLIITLIIVSLIFANWYTAVLSLGLVSLILGFALQTPITSFIGWIYILVRTPYRVGDRIEVGGAKGDVIDVSYLDTTLWEFGGQYLSSDHPSGRVIKIPNANILSTPVYNYTWDLFPYIWNEVKINVAYESDLQAIAELMRGVAAEELGAEMIKRISTFRELLAQTPVDELDVQEHPVILFRVSDNTWIEAIVRYLVTPRDAGRIKTILVEKLLNKMKDVPEQVMFPTKGLR